MKAGFIAGMVTGGIIGMAAVVTTIAMSPDLQSSKTRRMIRRGKKMMHHCLG